MNSKHIKFDPGFQDYTLQI